MMANLNRVMLIGRLGRDPETRTFANGGKVANFSICVNNRKKDQSGQWVDDPCWIDCSAFNRGDYGKTADLVEQYLRKGSQAYIEGKLTLDQWTDKDGQKRTKLKVVVDGVQFLDPKSGGQQAPGAPTTQQASAPRQAYTPSPDNDEWLPPPPAGRSDGEIPF